MQILDDFANESLRMGLYLEELAQEARLQAPASVPLQGFLEGRCKDGLLAQLNHSQSPVDKAFTSIRNPNSAYSLHPFASQ